MLLMVGTFRSSHAADMNYLLDAVREPFMFAVPVVTV